MAEQLTLPTIDTLDKDVIMDDVPFEYPTVSLLTITPEPEKLIAYAARKCYDSHHLADPERDGDLIQQLIRQGHHDVIEHPVASFDITCSRAVSLEIVRHRIASYNQRSQRFVTERDKNDWYLPPEIVARGERSVMLYEGAMDVLFNIYQELLREGNKKQIARYVLPNAWKTTLVCTWNFRTIRHILQMRAVPKAQPEFRFIALKILKMMLEIAPNVFADLEYLLNKTPAEWVPRLS